MKRAHVTKDSADKRMRRNRSCLNQRVGSCTAFLRTLYTHVRFPCLSCLAIVVARDIEGMAEEPNPGAVLRSRSLNRRSALLQSMPSGAPMTSHSRRQSASINPLQKKEKTKFDSDEQQVRLVSSKPRSAGTLAPLFSCSTPSWDLVQPRSSRAAHTHINCPLYLSSIYLFVFLMPLAVEKVLEGIPLVSDRRPSTFLPVPFQSFCRSPWWLYLFVNIR